MPCMLAREMEPTSVNLNSGLKANTQSTDLAAPPRLLARSLEFGLRGEWGFFRWSMPVFTCLAQPASCIRLPGRGSRKGQKGGRRSHGNIGPFRFSTKTLRRVAFQQRYL